MVNGLFITVNFTFFIDVNSLANGSNRSTGGSDLVSVDLRPVLKPLPACLALQAHTRYIIIKIPRNRGQRPSNFSSGFVSAPKEHISS